MLYAIQKRILDFVISFFALMLLWPVMILVAVAIKLDSKGPAVFRQERVTKDGLSFMMHKFRSMVINAEEVLQANPKLLKQYESGSYKLKDDPRVTRVGKFIRKTSLDELPQLWDVLMGDMSIVGPRAYRPVELQKQQIVYPETKPHVKALLTVKPGITGPWQISGRSNINFDQRVRMDALYAKKQSILYDILIILKTPKAVIQQEGAT